MDWKELVSELEFEVVQSPLMMGFSMWPCETVAEE